MIADIGGENPPAEPGVRATVYRDHLGFEGIIIIGQKDQIQTVQMRHICA